MNINSKNRRRFLQAGVGGIGAIGLSGAGLALSGEPVAKEKRNLSGLKPLYSRKARPESTNLLSVTLSTAPPPEVRALRRLTYGYRNEDLASFNSMGNTFDERLEAWVDDQLNGYQPVWPPVDDPELTSAIANSPTGWETLGDSLEKLWFDRARAGAPETVRDLPTWELTALTMLRAVYSRWQLAEVLADFWHVHFNVDTSIGERRTTSLSYDRDVIRPNMLGNFREMIEAVTKSNAMMHYLDQLWNSRYGPNENYARELQELHTLGAIHSFGFTPENEIPEAVPIPGSAASIPAGLKAGYSEADVRQATLCLTGWSIDRIEITENVNETGDYVFYADWHDPSPKHVLGIDFASSGEAEVHELLDLLAVHPNTARYVCTKLCRRLVNDDPPETLVEKAAEVFNDQWQAPDQLKQVVRTILLSDEFKDASNWGSKVRKPLELLCGTVRSCGGFTAPLGAWDGFKPTAEAPDWSWWEQQGEGHTLTRNLYWGLWESGGLPFRWVTPDGYPDNRAAWLAGSPVILGWKHLNFLFVSGRNTGPPDDEWVHFFPVDIVTPTVAALLPAERTASRLVDFWVLRLLGYDAQEGGTPQLDSATRTELVAFMQQDAPSADTPLDLEMPRDTWDNVTWRAYVPERLQVLVASIAMLPDHMLR